MAGDPGEGCLVDAIEVRRPKSFRVGMCREDGGGFRHVFTLMINGDGGVMVVPSRPATDWILEAAVPEGTSSEWTGNRPLGEDAPQTYSGPANRPRLHYHRSGWTTLDFQDRSDRRRVQINLEPVG